MPPVESEMIIEDAAAEKHPEESSDLYSVETNYSRIPGRWSACYFIFAHEALERMAWSTLGYNVQPYLEQVLHISSRSAFRIVNNWLGASALTSLAGGILADSYMGRFWTICLFSAIYLLGFILLTISVSISYFKPSCSGLNVCVHASERQSAFFYATLYLIAIGMGGVLPCVSAFGADQFDDRSSSERKARASYFNWFFFSTGLGSLVTWTALYYAEATTGWQWAFGIPTIAMSFALCTFLFGAPFYRYKRPNGSPLTKIAQVIVAAYRKRKVTLPLDVSRLYEEREIMNTKATFTFGEASRTRLPLPPRNNATTAERKLCHTTDFSFLDKAAVIDTIRIVDGKARIPISRWELCTISQVEELKLLLRIVPIWTGNLMLNIVVAQASSFFSKQGGLMDRSLGRFKVPPLTMSMVPALTILLAIPVYDRCVVPLLRRHNNHERGLGLLQRMAMAMGFGVLAMVVAALVERKRMNKAPPTPSRSRPPSSSSELSIFYLMPQYVLVGFADALGVVAQLEFFYDQVPDGMRSVGTALYFANVGTASFLTTLLVSFVGHVTGRNGHRPWVTSDGAVGAHLDYYYWLLGIMALVTLVFHVLSSYLYKYKAVCSSFVASSALLESQSFEWKPSELGLMQMPALFTHLDSQKHHHPPILDTT